MAVYALASPINYFGIRRLDKFSAKLSGNIFLKIDFATFFVFSVLFFLNKIKINFYLITAIKDRRIERITEVMSHMMILKVFAWEDVFEKKIWKLRSKELGYIKKFQYAIAVLMFVIMNTCMYCVY